MALNTLIPLQTRAPEVDLMGDYSRLLGLQQQRQQVAAQQEASAALAEQRRAATEQRQRAMADQQALDAAVKPGLSRDAVLSQLPGHLHSAVIESWDAADAASDRARKAKQDAEAADLDYFGALAAGVKAYIAQDPSGAMGAATLALQHAESAGHDVAPVRQQLESNPAALPQLLDALIARSPKYAGLAQTAAQHAESARHNQVSEGNARTAAEAAAADRAADNARQAAALSETQRHNRVVESREPQGPQAPVAIMGEDGKPVLVRPADAIGRRPANTREQGRAVTSGDAGRVADFDTSLDDVQVLRQTIAGNNATGTGAKVGAMLPDAVTDLTGLGTESKQKQAVIDRVKQVIGKALEGGVLRKEDEYKYEKILPKIADAPAIVTSKLNDLEAALVQRRQRLLDALEDAGYDVTRFNEAKASASAPAAVGGVPSYQDYLRQRRGGK